MARYGSPTAVSYSFGPGPMTPAVKAIIWTNIALYLVSLVYDPIIRYLGLTPEFVLERFWFWQVGTYMFLHASHPFHILFNMLGVWMFGVELERLWGTKFFARYYAVTGVGAGLTAIAASFIPVGALTATYAATTIGASGALYGLLMAFALRFPDRPILMFLFFPIPAKYFVMILGAIAFISAPGSQVSNAAHLGGLLFGYIYLKQQGRGGRGIGGGGISAEIKYRYLKWKMNRLRRKFDVYSGGKGVH